MFLATQYYRAPFPDRRYWADDFSRIRDSGLHAVQLWCLWGWIESVPGTYEYGDYDELVSLADKKGLKVVLSTIAEIHPFWIHRVAAGSEMIDHMGNKVISTCRGECNVGLTPGGCFDHPRVAELMGKFLTDIASRYAGAGNLLGWDCWNETRWSIHSDGYVCYCPDTLREFRTWLKDRHGDLAGLSEAWQRRYVSWEDVRPGKFPRGPYTETIEFLRFLTHRAARHAKFRYDAIRRGDGEHLISAHCGTPAIQSAGQRHEQALCRGVDWDLADQLDGFGCSHFPMWGTGYGEDIFGVRVESTRSANRGKVMWISELQGGSARSGITADSSVEPEQQQRWIASGMARGAKAVIFWCWRDEVFTTEASGFGLSGWDGLAEARLTAMKTTAGFIDKHDELIEAYTPDPARVGVLFVPDNYMLKWAEGSRTSGPADAVVAYATALERMGLPYEFVEARHMDSLDKLDVLLMPWCLILPDETQEAILKFIRRGGRIICEAETDAYDELSFYRYPNERPFMQALGVHDLGRRELGSGEPVLKGEIAGEKIELVPNNFTTPLEADPPATVLATNENGQPLLVRKQLGKGAAYVFGSFLGAGYTRSRNPGLEMLIEQICIDAGVRRDFELRVESSGDRYEGVLWRSGKAGDKNLLWLVNEGPAVTVTVIDGAGRLARASEVRELTTDKAVPIGDAEGVKQCSVGLRAGGFAVLQW